MRCSNGAAKASAVRFFLYKSRINERRCAKVMQPSDYPDMDRLCNEVLTAIELDELKLLNWGFVNVRSPLEETLPDMLETLVEPGASLWQEAQGWEISPGDILKNLLDRQLL